MEQRLQRILAAAGVGSRRHCETLITTGRVAVDGRVVTELGTKADPQKCEIALDGKPIASSQKKVYILLNKPPGYTSTRHDPHATNTVIDLVKDVDAFLYPVGRLDVDTSGLLILTNDGDLTKLLTHPSHEVEKTYVAVARGRISAAKLSRLERGVEMEDGVTAPARSRLLSYSSRADESTVELTIHEGRKRQVRRMFESIGHRVTHLSRTRLGELGLGELRQGEWRYLTQKEVAHLKKRAVPSSRARFGQSR